jgi:hypothetical protein
MDESRDAVNGGGAGGDALPDGSLDGCCCVVNGSLGDSEARLGAGAGI